MPHLHSSSNVRPASQTSTIILIRRRIVFPVFAVLATLFSISSFEYFWNYDTKSLTVWENVFGVIASESLAYGVMSVRDVMHEVYSLNVLALHIHAMTGSIMLFLGISQFWTAFRLKYPAVHRLLGKIYVVLAIPTCVGSAVYLYNATPDSVFSGPMFFIALSALAASTAFSTFMAVLAIRSRNIEAHRAWMLLSYFSILSAPILRAAWIVLYPFAPTLTHWDNNLYIVSPSAAIVVLGPLLMWGLTMRGSGPKLSSVSGLREPLLWVLPVSVSGAIYLTFWGMQINAQGQAAFGPVLPSSLVTLTGMLVASVMMYLRAVQTGRAWLQQGWRNMILAIVGAPITAVVTAFAFLALNWSGADSLTAGLLVALMFNPVFAYWAAIARLSRERSARLQAAVA